MGKPLDSADFYNKQYLLRTLFLAPTEYWSSSLSRYSGNAKTLREIYHLQSQNSISSIVKHALCMKPSELKQKNFQIKVEQPSIFIIVKLNQ